MVDRRNPELIAAVPEVQHLAGAFHDHALPRIVPLSRDPVLENIMFDAAVLVLLMAEIQSRIPTDDRIVLRGNDVEADHTFKLIPVRSRSIHRELFRGT